MRPPLKPPFDRDEVDRYEADDIPFLGKSQQQMTSMVLDVWERVLAETGYATQWPIESAEILRGISHGVEIEFEGDRSTPRDCVNLPSASVDAAREHAVTDIIEADVASGKKDGPHHVQPFDICSISPIGAVVKRGTNKIRMINNLSHPFNGDSINGSTVHRSMRLGSFDQATRAVRLLGPGCMLIKLDVEAAYKQVPVRSQDWPLLVFRWHGSYYFERCLPFGLKSSCRKWELYATAMHHFFVHRIHIEHVIHYIDDFLFVIKSSDVAQQQLADALSLCVELGIPMAAKKTEGPCTQLTFLGIQIDTVTMVASLSATRLNDILSLLATWESKHTATVKELQSLTGVLNWAAQVVRPGRAYLRRIIDHTTSIRYARHACPISDDVFRDIQWWRQFIAQWNGESILLDLHWSEAPYIELFTDACETGYGARYGRRWFKGEWDAEQRATARNRNGKRSMPYLELLALVLAASTWAHLWRGKRITFRCDCQPVRDAINNRSSGAPRSMGLVRHLSTIAARHQFDFRCSHIPGVLNVAADALSRDKMHEFRADQPDCHEHPSVIVTLPPLRQL